jgi:hypothetical protein
MTMTKTLLAVLVAIVVPLASLAPARADTPLDAAFAQLDDDGAIYVAVKPAVETAFWAWAKRAQTGELKAFYDDRVELDAELTKVGLPATIGGWESLGLDPTAPLAISFLAADNDDIQASFRALGAAYTGPVGKVRDRALKKAPRVWIRTRIVAKLADEARLRAALAKIPGLALVGGDPVAFAGIFGAADKRGKAIAAAWKRQKDLVGIVRVPGHHTTLAFARISGDQLIIDIVMLFGPAVPGWTLDWKRDGKALVKLVARKPKGALPWLQTASGKALASSELGIISNPDILLDAGKVLGWGRTIDEVAFGGGKDLLDQGSKEVLTCDEFRPLAAQGPMATLALVAQRTDSGIGLGAVWTLRDDKVLATTLATFDEGLVDLAAASKVDLLGLVALKDTAGLRTLARPGILDKGLPAIKEAATSCGAPADVVLTLFAPLQMLAIQMDAEQDIQPFFQTVSNAAVAARSTGGKLQAVFLGAFQGQPFHAMLDREAKRQKRTIGKRALTVWRKAKDKLTLVATPGKSAGSTVYGVSLGGDPTLDWWWGQPTPPSAGGPLPFVAMLRGDLPLFLTIFMPSKAGSSDENDAAKLARMRGEIDRRVPGLGDVKATVKLNGDVLMTTAIITIK